MTYDDTVYSNDTFTALYMAKTYSTAIRQDKMDSIRY